MRKSLLISLIFVMTFVVVLAGCTNDNNNSESSPTPSNNATESASETTAPAETKGLTIKMFAGYPAPVNPDYDNLMLWKEYEKSSGIHIDWDIIPSATAYERVPLMLASGDYPEIFYGHYFTPNDLIKYGSAGIFKPLNDLIPKFAPNLNAFLDNYPEIRKGMTMSDGNIYGLPTLVDPEYAEMLTSNKFWFKEDWLKQLGMNVPTTLDELFVTLKAFKDTDLNGNGKQDEVPLMVEGWYSLVPILNGVFGLQNRGAHHQNVDVDPQTNKVRFIQTDPRFKEVLQFLNKLYTEDILTDEILTMNYEKFIVKGSEGNVGAFQGLGESAFNGSGYIGAEAMTGPYGDRLWPYVTSPLWTSGAFVMTDKVKNPEEALRWADHFYSEEGIKTYFMGFDGVTYKQNADGSYAYMDNITHNPDGLTIAQAIGQYVVYPGTTFPSILTKNYYPEEQQVREKNEAATEKVAPYFPAEVWPEFTYTAAEVEEMGAIFTDIAVYLDQTLESFITGSIPFSFWDGYVKTINKMGLERYLQIYQAAYDRYSKS